MSNQTDAMEQIMRRHRALAVLRFLYRSAEYRANEEILKDWLRKLALTCTSETLREVASSLEREGHLRSDRVKGLLVMTLTDSGAEIALGQKFVEDVERPGPECAY